MDKRIEQLSELQTFINNIDNDFTMILQSLQWNKKGLQEPIRVTCKYDKNHTMHPDKREQHELNCFLKSEGYSSSDKFLPDPLDPKAKNLVKFCKTDINNIIDYAAKIDPLFKRGSGCGNVQPMTFERLQATYTADERCAIYDAVLKALPSCHDMPVLQLPSGEEKGRKKDKTLLETQAELRDMKRRRTKYRVAAKTKHYSDVLRQVINTQMELYTEMLADSKTEKSRQFNSEDRDKTNNDVTSTKNKKEQISNNERKLRDSKEDYKRDSKREYYLEDRKRHESDRRDKYDRKPRHEYNRDHRHDNYGKDGYSDMGRTQKAKYHNRQHKERESQHTTRSPERDETEKYRRHYDTKHERKKRRHYDNY